MTPPTTRPTWLYGNGALILTEFSETQKEEITALQIPPIVDNPTAEQARLAKVAAGDADPALAAIFAHLRGTGPKYDNIAIYRDADGKDLTIEQGVALRFKNAQAVAAAAATTEYAQGMGSSGKAGFTIPDVETNPATAQAYARSIAEQGFNPDGTQSALGKADESGMDSTSPEYRALRASTLADADARAAKLSAPKLVLIGTASGNSVTVDHAGVAAGIEGKSYSKDDIDLMSAIDQQALMDALFKKYDGVAVKIDDSGDYSPEFAMTVDDVSTYHQLLAAGAKRPAWKPAITPGDAPSTTPAPITQNTPVVVPTQVSEQLPVGTIVTKTAQGVHVASIPVEGTTHHVFASVGQQLLYLVSAVNAYFVAKKAGVSGLNSVVAGVGTLVEGEAAPTA